MEDTVISIIGIMVAAILMFIVPFVLIADRGDDIAQLTVSTLTTEFASNIIKTGVLTEEGYQQYLDLLATTGNAYDVEIELEILDENTAKKTVIDSTTPVIGKNSYYSVYTTQIEELLTKSDLADDGIYNNSGRIMLKEGDGISVMAKNSSKTLSQAIKNVYYAVKGEEVHIIVATSTGTISMNGTT